MEALIHHFKLVTEGFRVPAGQVFAAVESPRGELAMHVVSDGGTRPYRVHARDPSFANLQAIPAMCEGAMLSDVIAVVALPRPGHGWGRPVGRRERTIGSARMHGRLPADRTSSYSRQAPCAHTNIEPYTKHCIERSTP